MQHAHELMDGKDGEKSFQTVLGDMAVRARLTALIELAGMIDIVKSLREISTHALWIPGVRGSLGS